MLYGKYNTKKSGLDRVIFSVQHFCGSALTGLKNFLVRANHGQDTCETHQTAFCNKISRTIKVSISKTL